MAMADMSSPRVGKLADCCASNGIDLDVLHGMGLGVP
jgi:hypothetical protein